MSEDPVQTRSFDELGRVLASMQTEQRAQRDVMTTMNEKLATIPLAQQYLDRRIEVLEKSNERRGENTTANTKWIVASIVLPLFILLASPIVTLLIANALEKGQP